MKNANSVNGRCSKTPRYALDIKGSSSFNDFLFLQLSLLIQLCLSRSSHQPAFIEVKKRYEDFPRRDLPLSYEDKQVCSAYEQRHPGGKISVGALGKPLSDVHLQ